MQTELFQQEEEDRPILSVSAITKEIRKSLETRFAQIWIRGEVSNLRAHTSGHFYFILKDSKSQLKAVLFRGDAMGLAYIPKDGDECMVFGDITVYEARGGLSDSRKAYDARRYGKSPGTVRKTKEYPFKGRSI